MSFKALDRTGNSEQESAECIGEKVLFSCTKCESVMQLIKVDGSFGAERRGLYKCLVCGQIDRHTDPA